MRQLTPEEEAAERQLEAELAAFENVPVSTDDDPARQREFLEFKKVMNEMSSGEATVGSILGAMVYQISEQSEKRHKKGLEQAQPESSVMSQAKTPKRPQRKSGQ